MTLYKPLELPLPIADNHKYTLANVAVDAPSVTTVLKSLATPALTRWQVKQAAENMHDLITAEGADAGRREMVDKAIKPNWDAADMGTLAHGYLAHMLDDSQPYPLPPVRFTEQDAQSCHDGAIAGYEWLTERGFTPVWVERPVIHSKGYYGGTIDLVAQDSNMGLWVVDFKRAKRVYGGYGVQVAAYAACLESWGFTVVGGIVLQLPRSKRGNAHGHRVNLLAGKTRYEAALFAHMSQTDEHNAISGKIP